MHLIRGEDALEGLEPDDTEGDFILYKFVLKADGQIGTAPPQNTSVSPAFIRGQAGHSASFSCRAPTESSLNISWVKEGSEGIWKPPRHWLQTPSPGRLQVDIEQLQVEDRGNYTCIISNDIGETRHTLTLLLSYGPRSVESSPREMTAREGEPLTLSCSGDASPPPAITWTKDDDSPPPSWKVGATQGRATLSTAALAPRDAGIYLCTIQNSIGSETRVVSLTVQCDPTTSSAPDATSPPVSDPERSTASAAFTGDVQTTREGVTTAVSESAIDSTEREPAEPKGSTSSHTESDRETESTQSTEKVTMEDVPPITTTYVLCTMGPVAGLSSLGLVIHLIRRMKKKSLLELPQ
ncbi:leucine-rich repeats and immunoglobulin-like domains protein 3 [Amia ocellicauda]|uniref:leucine-rich repeats and immunoglobulin-like domains protein 3 n=1 Tax=Amia ocellicauda TaxID=2972642 RepID=UPI003463DEA7